MISSVFALDATTFDVIHGNKPVIKSFNNSMPHKLSVTIYKSDQKTELGPDDQIEENCWVFIKYKFQDDDGDDKNYTPYTSTIIQKTARVIIQNKYLNKQGNIENKWVELTDDDSHIFSEHANGQGLLAFRINKSYIGATKIGFKVLERTEFGVPYVNNWIVVTDITDSSDPYLQSAITKKDSIESVDKIGPTLTEIINQVEKVNHDFGPGESANGKYPVVNLYVRAGIFKYDKDGVLGLSTQANIAESEWPFYGDKYAAMVWYDKNYNGGIDDDEPILTDHYKFVWTLSGTANDVTASPKPLTKEQGVSGSDQQYIFLGSTTGEGHNYIYATKENGYKAGAQDFYLHLEPILK